VSGKKKAHISMSNDKATADIAGLPFEKALAELEAIVGELEKGQVALEDSIAKYERGEALKKHCDKLLKQAEARIEKINLSPSGEPSGVQPLDIDNG
jgi:exodeoxyribonuclease VII small subunit